MELKTILFIPLIGLVFLLMFTVYTQSTAPKPYQGPVPEGYNLEHFRQTGETKKAIFVETELGCLQVKDYYTDDEWDAKERLVNSLGIKMKRCVGGKS